MGKASILYVDDEEDNLITFKSVFRRNYVVNTVLSGVEALEFLQENEVDLLITDQRMPKMTGTQLLREVVKKHPTVARMVLTGFSDVDDIIDAINEGKVHSYATKPWSKEGLHEAIEKTLTQNRELIIAKKQILALEKELDQLKQKAN